MTNSHFLEPLGGEMQSNNSTFEADNDLDAL